MEQHRENQKEADKPSALLKRTPLYQNHLKLGAKMVDFAGWEMPVQYSNIVEEHLAVRNNVGVFDISHMGQVIVSGGGARAFLNFILTNDVSKLNPGEAQYSLMCNEKGGVIDDLYVYCIEEQKYLLIINASRTDRDIAHIFDVLSTFSEKDSIQIQHLKNNAGAIAIQGQNAASIVKLLLNAQSIEGIIVNSPVELKKNQIAKFNFEDNPVWVSRTGYTGEDGFEVFSNGETIVRFWERLFEVGNKFGLQPAGLGARDTLRLEACYPLYGHELDETTTPLEAGLVFFVSFNKGEFIGRSALVEQKTKGEIKKRCVAFKMLQKSPPPRTGYLIWHNEIKDNPVGIVTSGTHSPMLNIGIGMGYVKGELASTGAKIEIEIRGKKYPAEIVKKPFYKKV